MIGQQAASLPAFRPFSRRRVLDSHCANQMLPKKLGKTWHVTDRLTLHCGPVMLARHLVVGFLRLRGKKEPTAVGVDTLLIAPAYPGLRRRLASFFPIGLLADFFCPAA